MKAERAKVAPWETYTDGEWHEVRHGPEGEARAVSARQYRRHYQSMRAWCEINGFRGQLSQTDYGRILRVRMTVSTPARDAGHLAPRSRGEIGRLLIAAMHQLDYALNLRQYGERAPDETWAQFDRNAEALLRKIRSTEEPG